MKIFDFKKEKAKQAEEGEYTMDWPWPKWDDFTKLKKTKAEEQWEAGYQWEPQTCSSSEPLNYADMMAAVKFLEEMPKPTAYVLPVSPEILQLKNADYIGFESFINGGVVFPNLKKTPSLHPRGIDKFDHLLEEG